MKFISGKDASMLALIIVFAHGKSKMPKVTWEDRDKRYMNRIAKKTYEKHLQCDRGCRGQLVIE